MTRPTAEPTPRPKDWWQQVTSALEDLDHLMHVDAEAQIVSVEFEHGSTCDVEFDTVQGMYTVTLRTWDRTGGMSSETELGSVRRARHAAAIVKDVRAEASYAEAEQ